MVLGELPWAPGPPLPRLPLLPPGRGVKIPTVSSHPSVKFLVFDLGLDPTSLWACQGD